MRSKGLVTDNIYCHYNHEGEKLMTDKEIDETLNKLRKRLSHVHYVTVRQKFWRCIRH